MTVKARIETTTVIRALSDLDYYRRGVRVTPERIAEHLKCDVKDVKRHLRTMEAKRLIKRKRSQGETVIHPWAGQRS